MQPLLIIGLLHIVLGQNPPGIDFQSFSGRWEGTESLFQSGECLSRSGARDDFSIRLQVAVKEDGTFSAQAFLMGSKTPVPDIWTGKIDSDQHVIMTVPGRAACKGQRREYTKTYSGRLSKSKGKYELVVEADDVPCPDMGCAFKSKIKVRQK